MCSVELEPCEAWDQRTVTARKPHICHACGGAIRPGDRYVRHFSVLDGDVCLEKQCPACTEDVAAFAADHDGQRSNPSYMSELISGCIAEGDPDSKRWSDMMDRWEARRAARKATAAGAPA